MITPNQPNHRRSTPPLAASAFLALVSLAFLNGCSSEAIRGSDEDLDARLAAASNIQDLHTADKAMSDLALRAATVDNEMVSKSAAQHIKDIGLRDSTAVTCAHRLVSLGDRTGAIDIAGVIANPATRDATMDRLARWGDHK